VPTRLPGSFRDPAGHILISDGTVYRRIEPAGREAYDRLMQSGLYDALVAETLLIPHEDLGPSAEHPGASTILRPEQIPMVSYPYEWCFSHWRDAALVTLRAQRRALEFGMSLKDASAYNVQFLRGRLVLIDTLSFEPYAGGPWVAYRQFCQHFYAPLLLMSAVDGQLGRLARPFVDGIPLGLAAKLLPWRSWLKSGPLLHVHLHAAAEKRWSRRGSPIGRGTSVGRAFLGRRSAVREGGTARQARRKAAPYGFRSRRSSLALVDSLERAIEALSWKPRSEWASYYDEGATYDSAAFARKSDTVGAWLDRLRPAHVWDLGANTGQFSKLAARHGAEVVACDADVACIELLYREARNQNLSTILPLVFDLSNPSPAIGWANEERLTLQERGPADLIMALALVHHLAIGNNVPLPSLASYFARLGRRAIVEFVPKSDPMVRHMLASREDVFTDYTVDGFERSLAGRFTIDERVTLSPSDRVLYLLTAR
jgi:hypothetical protein